MNAPHTPRKISISRPWILALKTFGPDILKPVKLGNDPSSRAGNTGILVDLPYLPKDLLDDASKNLNKITLKKIPILIITRFLTNHKN